MAEGTAQVEEEIVEEEQPEPVTTDSLFDDTEEEEKSFSEVPAEDQKSAPDNEDAEARLLETQKWGNQQSEALAQANAKIEEMQGRLVEQVVVEDSKKLDDFKEQIGAVFDDDEYFENPAEAHKKALGLILEAVNSNMPTADQISTMVGDSTRREVWVTQENTFMAEHDDYEEVVSADFVSFMGENPKLRSSWETRGQTPAALYDMAKKWHTMNKYMEDPDGFYVPDNGEVPKQKSITPINTGDTPSSMPPPDDSTAPAQGMNDYIFNELAASKEKRK